MWRVKRIIVYLYVMNLKRIIKEEVNDFEWTQSIDRPIESGDTVRCLPGFTTEEDSGGSGYEEGKEFVVESIDRYEDGDVLWSAWDINRDENSFGVYSRAVELVEYMNESNDFEWTEDIPHNISIGEIKKLEQGFRSMFNFNDIIGVEGSIPCESTRNEGCIIDLSGDYEVVGIHRTRIKIRPMDDVMSERFIDEWDEDSVWIGVDSSPQDSDDDIRLHTIVGDDYEH
jgi:hypothetical protein